LPTVPFPTVRGGEENAHSAEEPRQARHTSLFFATDWVLALAGLTLVGSESILLGLIPAQSAAVSSLSFSGEFYALVLMTAILVGRSLATVLFRITTTRRVIALSVALVTLGGAFWSLFPPLAPLFVFLSGLGTASLFPGLIAYVSENRPAKAGATIAAIGWTGGLGGTLLPAVTGLALSAGIPDRLTSGFVVLAALGAFLLIRRSSPSAGGPV
jgi:MFS family permease